MNSMDEGGQGVGGEGGESSDGGGDGVKRGTDRKTASVRWEKEKIKSDRPKATRSVKRMFGSKSGVFAACHTKVGSGGSRVSMLAAHQAEESQEREDSEQVLDIRSDNYYQARNGVDDPYDHGVVEEERRAELYRHRTKSLRSRDLERGLLVEEQEVYEMKRIG